MTLNSRVWFSGSTFLGVLASQVTWFRRTINLPVSSASRAAPREDLARDPLVRNRRFPALWVFLVAVLFRGVVSIIGRDHFEADPDAYVAIAETLGRSGVYGLTAPSGEVVPTAFRPPLYPYLLSWFVEGGELRRLLVAILHSLLGGLTAVCTFLTCRVLLGPRRGRLPSILASALVIVDPILVQQSTFVMTETLATALASLVMYWWVSRVMTRFSLMSIGGLGVLLALACLCRPTFVVWAVLLIVGVVFGKAPAGLTWSRRIAGAGLAAAIVLVVMALWTGRNAVAIGHPVWATTHGGYTLLLGNNPLIFRHLRDDGPFHRWDPDAFLNAYAHRYEGDSATEQFWLQAWDAPVREQPELSAVLSEHDDDRVAYQAAKATIEREPSMFLLACIVRVFRLWTPFPYVGDGRSLWKVLGIGIYYCLIYLAAMIGLSNIRRAWGSPAWWPIPALVLTLTMVHAVYWSNMRMRAPAIPAIAILASFALWKGETLRWDNEREE